MKDSDKDMSTEEEVREYIEERVKWGIEDGRKMGIEEGRKEGRKEGLKEGRQEGLEQGDKNARRAIAVKLLSIGTAVEVISECTGLSAEEIKSL